MRLNKETYHTCQEGITSKGVIDLSGLSFITPWGLIATSLLCFQYQQVSQGELILPTNSHALTYLRRAGFATTLKLTGHSNAAAALDSITISELENLNIQKLVHCRLRDELKAHQDRILMMFEHFGMTQDQAELVTQIVLEIAENVFEHNNFMESDDITGVFIAAQRYPQNNEIEVAIGDYGRGFSASLRERVNRDLPSTEALRLGLQRGVTGRLNENRGFGLDFVRATTLDTFKGILTMQSYDGKIVLSDLYSIQDYSVPTIRGSIVDIVIKYT